MPGKVTSVGAVLLAGGESRRMGRDKATLLFRERPLWQRQLELLRELEPAELIVSARTDPPWRPPEIGFVADETPSRGPMSGLAAALAQMHSSHLLALGIDMPFMTAEYLCALCETAGGESGAIPINGGRYEPLAAVYPQSALADVRSALAGDDYSLQNLCARLVAGGKLRAVKVAEEERALFRNLNTPADLVG